MPRFLSATSTPFSSASFSPKEQGEALQRKPLSQKECNCYDISSTRKFDTGRKRKKTEPVLTWTLFILSFEGNSERLPEKLSLGDILVHMHFFPHPSHSFHLRPPRYFKALPIQVSILCSVGIYLSLNHLALLQCSYFVFVSCAVIFPCTC